MHDTPRSGETTSRRAANPIPAGLELGARSGYLTPLELVGKGGMGSLLKIQLHREDFVAPYISAHILSGDVSPPLVGIYGKYQLDDPDFEEEVRRRVGAVDRKSSLFRRMTEELEKHEPGLVQAGYVAALKMPSGDDAALASRFFREVRILHNMGDHPNIVKYISCDLVEGRLALIMEFVPWPNLSQTLQEKKLPVGWAMEAFVQILRAVHHAHLKGVVHRDIKPSNILTDGREVKITDFGLAKPVSLGEERTQLTLTDQMIGTPAYMAPEQIDPMVGALGEWTDVYQLGVTLFEMIARRPLYDDKDYKRSRESGTKGSWRDSDPRKQILAEVGAVGRMHPRFPRDFDPTISEEVEKFVMTLCQKDILERYTCELALEHAEEILRHKLFVHAEPFKPPSEERKKESQTTLILSASEALLAKRTFEESEAYARGSARVREAEGEADVVARADHVELAAEALSRLPRAKFPELHDRLEALIQQDEPERDDIESFRPNRKIALEIARAYEALASTVEADNFYETPTSHIRSKSEALLTRAEQHLERIRKTGLPEKIVRTYVAQLEVALREVPKLPETHAARKQVFVRRKREELEAAVEKNPNEAAMIYLTLKRAFEAGGPDEPGRESLEELELRFKPLLDSGSLA